MANKPVERCSMWLVFREMQMKTSQDPSTYPLMANIRGTALVSVGKGGSDWESPPLLVGRSNGTSHFGKQFICYRVKYTLHQ